MRNIKRIANMIEKLLLVIKRWTTKRTLIEWYNDECKKDTLVIVFAVHSVDGDLYTYAEQMIAHSSNDITTALKDVKTKVGASCVTTGYEIVEYKLIKELIEQHMTVQQKEDS